MAAPSQPPALSPRQLAAVERCRQLAESRRLAIVGEGVCRVPGRFQGAGVWAVRSATRPNLCHLVWLYRGRLLCSCEARRSVQVFTCSHAQAVRCRLLLEAGAVEHRSIPSVESSASEPVASPPAPALPVCPSCGLPTDAVELEQLGTCWPCLKAEVDAGRPRCPCGNAATGETAEGYICDDCAARRREEQHAQAMERTQAPQCKRGPAGHMPQAKRPVGGRTLDPRIEQAREERRERRRREQPKAPGEDAPLATDNRPISIYK